MPQPATDTTRLPEVKNGVCANVGTDSSDSNAIVNAIFPIRHLGTQVGSWCVKLLSLGFRIDAVLKVSSQHYTRVTVRTIFF
jgi:hypothetical protein